MHRIHGSGDSDPRSILVVLPTWVGDFVMATPALRAIRERFADARITFLMEPNLRELVRGGDWMDSCVEWPGKGHRTPFHKEYRGLVRNLRGRGFDWAVLLPNSLRSALIARISGARRVIGYDRDGRTFLLTDRLPVKNRRRTRVDPAIPKLPVKPGRFAPLPIVEYYADMAEAIGCDRPDDQLSLSTTLDCDQAVDRRLTSASLADRHPLAVISPGAKYGASKCWFPERFAAVADRLIKEESAAVVVTCGPGEESIARQIGSAMKQHGSVFDDPLLSLGELKSLVRRSDLLICNDAGPRHIAKAFNVPVVTVFGPTHPEWTATSYEAERIVRVDVECGPCQQPVCPLGHLDCMTQVTVDAVLEASVGLLRDGESDPNRARHR